jgi:branched-subunit amino acid aminotransferase/4-amino-4-deoxychorismate lyase
VIILTLLLLWLTFHVQQQQQKHHHHRPRMMATSTSSVENNKNKNTAADDVNDARPSASPSTVPTSATSSLLSPSPSRSYPPTTTTTTTTTATTTTNTATTTTTPPLQPEEDRLSRRGGSSSSSSSSFFRPFVSINGEVMKEEDADRASISVFDTSLQRGDGVFEVMKVVRRRGATTAAKKKEEPNDDDHGDNSGGNGAANATPRAATTTTTADEDGVVVPHIRFLDVHLDRLLASSKSLGCPLPDVCVLRRWLEEAAAAVAGGRATFNDNQDGEGGGEDDDQGGGGGVALRLLATKGDPTGSNGAGRIIAPSVVISSMPIPAWPETFTLLPLLAPWHPAGLPGWESPIKWTSYGPNVISTNRAKGAGYTDALLLSPHRVDRPSTDGRRDGRRRRDSGDDSTSPSRSYFNRWDEIPLRNYHVLDGPNFAVAWIQERRRTRPTDDADRGHDHDHHRDENDDEEEDGDGGGADRSILTPPAAAAIGPPPPPPPQPGSVVVLHLPCHVTLGMLPSVTQRMVEELARTELGWEVRHGVYTLGEMLDDADEVIVMSTTRGVRAVTKIGDHDVAPSPPSSFVGTNQSTPGTRAAQLTELLRKLM